MEKYHKNVKNVRYFYLYLHCEFIIKRALLDRIHISYFAYITCKNVANDLL